MNKLETDYSKFITFFQLFSCCFMTFNSRRPYNKNRLPCCYVEIDCGENTEKQSKQHPSFGFIDKKENKISLKRRNFKNNDTRLSLKQQSRREHLHKENIWEEKTRAGTVGPDFIDLTNRTNHGNTGNQPFQSKIYNSNFLMPTNSVTSVYYDQKLSRTVMQTKREPQCSVKNKTDRQMISNIRSQPNFHQQPIFTPTNKTKFKIPIIPTISRKNSITENIKNRRKLINQKNEENTIQSDWNSQQMKERISQSTIQIDFFNPSENRLNNLWGTSSRKKC